MLLPVLEFRETHLFTRQITSLLGDDEYARLQGVLVVTPEAGDLIPGTAGLRKLRWSERRRGKGKRGGIRVVYYFVAGDALVYMLLAYSKGERDDLTAVQKRAMMRLISEEFR
jgi:hypothetical protein